MKRAPLRCRKQTVRRGRGSAWRQVPTVVVDRAVATGEAARSPGSGLDGPRTVLVGVDESLGAQRALFYAAGVSRRNQAHLILVHVRRLLSVTGCAATWAYPCPIDIADDGTSLLDELSRLTEQQFGVGVEGVLRDGVPAREIASLARERNVDMIVVGRARSILHRLTGSVGAGLMARSNCPVVVVP